MRRLILVLLGLLFLATATPAWAQTNCGTTVPPATSITDAGGAVWTLNGTSILENGTNANGGGGTEILLFNGTVYALSGDGWWQWTGTTWSSFGATAPNANCSSTTIFTIPSLPHTFTVAWNAEPASANVTKYTVTLDSGTPVTTAATAVSSPITVTTAGSHTVSVTASNAQGTSAPSSVTFAISIQVSVPPPVIGLTVK